MRNSEDVIEMNVDWVHACRKHLQEMNSALEAQENFFANPLSAMLRQEAHVALKTVDRPIPSHPTSLRPFLMTSIQEVMRLKTGCSALLSMAATEKEAWPDLEKAVAEASEFVRHISRTDPTLFPEPSGRKRKAPVPVGEWVAWDEDTVVYLMENGVFLSVSGLNDGWVARVAGVFVHWTTHHEKACEAAEEWGKATFQLPPSSPGNM